VFVDTDQFPFLEDLRHSWRGIRAECLALAHDSFEPWVQREMYGEGWSVYGLIAFGTRIDAALTSCPEGCNFMDRVLGEALRSGVRVVGGCDVSSRPADLGLSLDGRAAWGGAACVFGRGGAGQGWRVDRVVAESYETRCGRAGVRPRGGIRG
jgi:hypothetical protein